MELAIPTMIAGIVSAVEEEATEELLLEEELACSWVAVELIDDKGPAVAGDGVVLTRVEFACPYRSHREPSQTPQVSCFNCLRDTMFTFCLRIKRLFVVLRLRNQRFSILLSSQLTLSKEDT